MNFELKNSDSVNAILTIKIEKADYEDRVEKAVREYRKKANIPGFRPGMVPVGMIKKMYGNAFLFEELDKLVNEGIEKYVAENKLSLLGQVLPHEAEEPQEPATDGSYSFSFDLGLVPQYDTKFTKKDKLKYYNVVPDAAMIDNQVKAYTGRYGSYTQEEVVEEHDMVRGVAMEVTPRGGKEVEGGVSAENAILTPAYLKDEAVKEQFIGAKVGDSVVFSPQKAFDKSEAEIASFLKVDKEQAAAMKNNVKMSIEGITRYKEAEINQELFDKVFGEGVVTTEEEFNDKVKADLQDTLNYRSESQFAIDLKPLLLKKVSDVPFPEEFFKKLLFATNKEESKNEIESQFDSILSNMQLQLLINQIAKEENVQISKADLDVYLKGIAKMRFAQYGMMSVPDDILENYARDMMKDRKMMEDSYETLIQKHVIDIVKSKIALETVEITADEFDKKFVDKGDEAKAE